MLYLDPPEHTRDANARRQGVRAAVASRSCATHIAEIVERLLDAVHDQGGMDVDR